VPGTVPLPTARARVAGAERPSAPRSPCPGIPSGRDDAEPGPPAVTRASVKMANR
jgi:hypothetical protein